MPTGDRDATAVNGANGINGVNGAANVVYRRTDTNFVAVGGGTSTSVYCEPGERVLGGAAAWVRQPDGLVESNASVGAAAPTDGGGSQGIDLTADQGTATGYVFAGRNTSSGMAALVGYVICAKP